MFFADALRTVQELPEVEGLNPAQLLTIPEPMGRIFRLILGLKEISAGELAYWLVCTEDEARQIAEILVQKGYLLLKVYSEEQAYSLRFSKTRHRFMVDL